MKIEYTIEKHEDGYIIKNELGETWCESISECFCSSSLHLSKRKPKYFVTEHEAIEFARGLMESHSVDVIKQIRL